MDVTLPRPVFALAFLLVLVVGASYELRAWLRETDARQARPVALCPNWGDTLIYSTHYDQTKRDTTPVRVIPAPDCLEDTTR